MSAAPRAARKGKVASASPEAVTPPNEQVAPSSAAGSVTPPSESPTPGSLLASFLQASDATVTSAPVGVGVVRGRGVSVNVKESTTTADRSDVESRVRAAVEGISAPTEWDMAADIENAPLRHISHNDVTLAPDSDGLVICAKLAATAKTRVLIVSPTIVEATLATLRGIKGVGAIAALDGSSLTGGNANSKVVYVTLAVALQYFKYVHFTGDFVFTHVVFLHCLHAGKSSPEFDVVMSLLRDEMRNTRREKCARVVIVGASRDEFAGYFDPLRCAEVSATSGRSGSLTIFTADETAALCDVSLKTPGSAPIPRGPTTAAEAIHPRLVEHATDTGRLLIELLIDHFDASKPMRCVVFAPDVFDFEAALKRKQVDEKVVVSRSVDALAVDVGRATVVVLSQALSDSAARRVHANVMIDLGLERRLVAAPPAEATMPLRQIVRASTQEVAARLHTLGWQSSGIGFQVLAGPPASMVCEEDTLPVMSLSVLRSIRAGAPAAAVREGRSRAAQAHASSVDASLSLLGEQCAIVAPERPELTFLGDMAGRLPLPVEGGVVIAHGLVFGMPEAFAAVAVAMSHDVFGSCPLGAADPAKWQAAASTYLQSTREGAFSDVLAAAHVIIDAKNGDIEAVAASTQANPAALQSAVAAYEATLKELRDYAFLGVPVATLHQQLEQHLNHIIYVIATTLARNAVLVRSEADGIKGARERGRMMLQRTAKDVHHNAHHPSGVKWANGAVVVPAALSNTHSKIIVSNATTLSHSFFHAALLLLHPALSFDVVEEGSAHFCVNVNRHPKRLIADIQTTARVLDFREKWCQLFGVAQAKRSMPRNTTQSQFNAFVASSNRKLDLESMRNELLATLIELVQGIETKETQAAPALSRSQLLAAATIVTVSPVAPGSDEIALQAVLEGKPEPAEAASTSAAGAVAAAEDDDVEVEGAAPAAPIIEDDVEVEGAAAAPILEED